MKQGAYKLSMQDYQKDPAPAPSLSSGMAKKLVSQSPLHARIAHPRLNPAWRSEESTEYDLGSCSHAVLLEGEGAIAAIEADDWRTKAAKEAREAARAQGQIPILARKLPDVRAMADTARAALAACEIPIDLTTGVAEQVLIWQEKNGIWCRCRPDWRRPGLILDYKSTAGSAEPSAWIRNQMVPLGFDIQSVHYMRGDKAVFGAPTQFIFLVQENYPPYECSFVGMSPGMIEIAQRKWDIASTIWQRCLEADKWPGYVKTIAYAEPSAWQIDEDEERRLTFDEIIDRASAL